MITNILGYTADLIVIKPLIGMKVPHDIQSLSRIIFFNLIANQACHDLINHRSQIHSENAVNMASNTANSHMSKQFAET